MSKRLFVGALVALSVTAVASTSHAEEPEEPGPWKYGAVLGLNLSQSAFSNNWAGGDRGSITWVSNADFDAKRQVSNSFHWSNLLQLAYGQTAQQVEGDSGKEWDRPEKTTDLVLFESVGRFTLNSWADPYLAFRLDTQFLDESNPLGELMFNPIKLTETAGIARVLEKSEETELVSRLGFGFRQSIARTFIGPDETESFSTNDGGFEWATDATYPLLDNKVQYKGKLQVFFPVFFSASEDLEEFDTLAQASDASREEVQDFWKTPDVNFQNSFDAKITEWLSVNLYLQWVYDKFDAATNVDTSLPIADLISEVDGGIRKAGQFKQTLALSISYRFL